MHFRQSALSEGSGSGKPQNAHIDVDFTGCSMDYFILQSDLTSYPSDLNESEACVEQDNSLHHCARFGSSARCVGWIT